ncbi:hypothetical protein Y032_0151g2808 [Ancylostoma ceylanicum]|uniref:Uncharacterized protein n=1 Tax=Ancylostoma ceylanicum TaxID=53326 RepID=A0A016T0U2_9BILA|nr:hypothetical protein Y032_0151g2808 [Ancylostoma ceylanicum]
MDQRMSFPYYAGCMTKFSVENNTPKIGFSAISTSKSPQIFFQDSDSSNRRFEMRVAGSPIRERGDESCETQTEDEAGSPRSPRKNGPRTPSPAKSTKSTSPAKSTRSTTSRKDTDDGSNSDSTRKTAQTTYV